MDDHAGYRDEVEEHGFHFIHCERQPQDECHRVQREDIQLVGPDGTVSENQNVDHLADGTPVVAKYPGRLYDVDQFFPAVVVRSKFNVSCFELFVFVLSLVVFPCAFLFTALKLVVLPACFVFVGAGAEAHLYCAVRSRKAHRDRLLV